MIIEVVYATIEKQILCSCKVSEKATVKEAIILSGILDHFPEIDLEKQTVGIFSKKVSLETELREGDRVEIYRKLKIDPKQARRLRAERTKLNKNVK